MKHYCVNKEDCKNKFYYNLDRLNFSGMIISSNLKK